MNPTTSGKQETWPISLGITDQNSNVLTVKEGRGSLDLLDLTARSQQVDSGRSQYTTPRNLPVTRRVRDVRNEPVLTRSLLGLVCRPNNFAPVRVLGLLPFWGLDVFQRSFVSKSDMEFDNLVLFGRSFEKLYSISSEFAVGCKIRWAVSCCYCCIWGFICWAFRRFSDIHGRFVRHGLKRPT